MKAKRHTDTFIVDYCTEVQNQLHFDYLNVFLQYINDRIDNTHYIHNSFHSQYLVKIVLTVRKS